MEWPSLLVAWPFSGAVFGAMTTDMLTQKTFIGQFLRKIRRFFLGTFQPDRVEQSIQKNRKGECHRCGLCCELIYRCPFLGKDADQLPYCRIYGDLRPASCRNYPFDAIDSEIDQCGFKFPEVEQPKEPAWVHPHRESKQNGDFPRV